MKRFFTLFMAIWALLSISQAVKAADVTVYFQRPDGWSTPVHAYVYDDAGNYHKEWKDAEACTPYYTSTGIELWSYTFPDKFTNVIFKDGTHQHPGNDGSKMKVVNNYVYTINSTTGTSLSEFDKITKVIKLFNGPSELTGSNGKYTLDLSSATADAAITLTIDDTPYGLAEVQTIKAVGNYNVDFTANEEAALTLAKGFIYSLSVTEDGKMTVVAKEKGVANGNYYLIGNFFTDDDKEEINKNKKYFRFTDNGDGTLSFDIPATLSVNAQVLASDGTCYGPVNGESGYGISHTHPSADEVFVKGNLVAGKNYWKFADRLLTGDGIYKVTIKVDETGVPTSWRIDFDKTQRMAYFLEDPEETHDAVAHPCYAKKKHDGSCDNKFFGNVYLDAKQHCYVVGNICVEWENNIVKLLKTKPKLYLQGNGGRDVTTNTGGTSDGWKYTNVFPEQKGFYFPSAQSLYLEYNPSAGNFDARVNGIAGEVKRASGNFDTPITSIQIVGDGVGDDVVDSWDLKKALNMTYNKTLDCWECTIKTTKSESADRKFRFIANGGWAYNWGEESTKPEDQARTPHDLVDDKHLGHEASITDPNNLSFTTDGSEANRNGSGTFGDIIFNRPAGEWKIRFYSRAVSNGNDYIKAYGYTITGREYNGIPLTYCAGKFIRTYSNNVAMDIIDPNVKVYEAYKYTMPDQVENIYSQGTLELRQLKYIPANMGVVLIGTVPATEANKYTDGAKLNFSISKRTEKSADKDEDYVDVWTKADEYKAKNEKWNNFLVPTVEAVPNLGNAKFDDADNVIYRYFGLANFFRTLYYKEHGGDKDYIGFFRYTAKGASDANKAYLSLPTRKDLKGGEFGFINYNGQFIGTKDEDNESLAKVMIVFDDEMGAVTEIKHVEATKNTDNAYYTLQGVKVLRPAKGIYIHNGKKIVFK